MKADDVAIEFDLYVESAEKAGVASERMERAERSLMKKITLYTTDALLYGTDDPSAFRILRVLKAFLDMRQEQQVPGQLAADWRIEWLKVQIDHVHEALGKGNHYPGLNLAAPAPKLEGKEIFHYASMEVDTARLTIEAIFNDTAQDCRRVFAKSMNEVKDTVSGELSATAKANLDAQLEAVKAKLAHVMRTAKQEIVKTLHEASQPIADAGGLPMRGADASAAPPRELVTPERWFKPPLRSRRNADRDAASSDAELDNELASYAQPRHPQQGAASGRRPSEEPGTPSKAAKFLGTPQM